MQSKRLILSRSQSEAWQLSRALSACGIANTPTRPPRSKQMPSCAWAIAIDDKDTARAKACLKHVTDMEWCWGNSDDLSG